MSSFICFFFLFFAYPAKKSTKPVCVGVNSNSLTNFLLECFFFCLIGSRSSLRFHHCHLATPQMQWSSRIVDEERCRVEKEDIKQRFAAIWSHAVVMSGALN